MPEIVRAGTKDIPLIQQLTYAIWPDAYKEILQPDQLAYMLELFYSTDALTHQIENLDHQFLLVYDNNTAVGFSSYSPKKSGHHSVYRLHKLYVLPGHQGKGTGKFILDHIVNEIKNAGAAILELNVNRHNKALHFYKKSGFVISKEEDIDIGSGYYMNDYVMELRI